CAIAEAQPQVTVIHSFNGEDGRALYSGLVQAADGDFYGSSTYGGDGAGTNGAGTIFKMKPDGTFTLLHVFVGPPTGPDNVQPSRLMQANDGNLYGTTQEDGNFGCGTIFKMTPDGNVSVLYSFT